MKAKELKQWLSIIPDDVDINYSSGIGFHEITCFVLDKTLCLSATPYGVNNPNTISLGAISRLINSTEDNNPPSGTK